MTNLIRICVGEIIEVKNGTKFLIAGQDRDKTFYFINLENSAVIEEDWADFEKKYIPTKRVGFLGQNILGGDDWLCHDGRCYPSILAGGGCKSCEYGNLGSTQKRYYEPGDTVWIRSEKTEDIVTDVSLFQVHDNFPREVLNTYFGVLKKYAAEKGTTYDIRFELAKHDGYFRWTDLRCVKRKRHFLNIEQLDYVCSELCLFGPYQENTERCFECVTGKIQRSKRL